MGIMESFKNKCFGLDVPGSKYIAGVVFLSFICYFLQSLGLVTPYWVKYDQGSSLATVGYFYGIWSECSTTTSGPTACVTWDSGSLTGTFRAAQAFELLAFIFQTGAEVGMIIFAFHDSKKFHKVIAVVIGSLFLVSSVLTLMGAILFSSDNSVGGSFSWAFGLSIFGGITSVPFGLFFVYIFFITKQRKDNYKKTPRVKVTFVKNTNLKF
ncbi:uncharacterized protein LOC110448190 [Mizuhopecten yessoensis]|uniref:Lens fiber membrane intrinsic protein n=1 Tax=Mizuhopecten yessoensis TaxID=6573 RepID=A0A210R5P8_MIZYE|nr:uncharacterized protein LOC110448190 [Mizuhopecten yessoensis]OWF56369.1 hypothetical protein KP79_PYT14403 [Mizuhopecten yessoensis]